MIDHASITAINATTGHNTLREVPSGYMRNYAGAYEYSVGMECGLLPLQKAGVERSSPSIREQDLPLLPLTTSIDSSRRGHPPSVDGSIRSCRGGTVEVGRLHYAWVRRNAVFFRWVVPKRRYHSAKEART